MKYVVSTTWNLTIERPIFFAAPKWSIACVLKYFLCNFSKKYCDKCQQNRPFAKRINEATFEEWNEK